MSDQSGYERLSLNDYEMSYLSKWLQYDTWTSKEAVLLICDIDPNMAVIDWHSEIDVQGAKYKGPFIANAQLFSKQCPMFYHLPAKHDDEVSAKIGPPWEIADTEKIDKRDRYLLFVRDKELELEEIEGKLIQIWQVLQRSPTTQELANDKASPQWYVDWAISKGIEIPWFDWAEERGLVKLPTRVNPADKGLDKRYKDSLITLIAALLHQLDIDPSAHGNIKKIVGITEDYGAPIRKTTISKIRDEISSAKESVQDRRRR